MLAICAGIAVGLMVAIGGNDGVDGNNLGSHDLRAGTQLAVAPLSRDGAELYMVPANQGGIPVEATPAANPTSGSTRLVLGALSADGTPEPGVAAAAATETVAIPEPVVKESLAPAVYDLGSVQALIVSYDWPDEDALRIAYCESRYDPLAVNPTSGAAGVFQFLDYWHHDKLAPGESWFDPAVNVRIAYQVWLDQGWQPWNVGGCW